MANGRTSPQRWWDNSPGERYWLEITGRPDIGANLNAPAGDKNGKPNWSYALIHEVADGDVVLHYDTSREAIVGYSRAVGKPWADSVVWAARGRASRMAGIEPHSQPGWYLALERFTALTQPVTRAMVTERRNSVLALAARLKAESSQSVHFPFSRYRDGVRAFQGYLVKFPSALIDVFEELREVRDGVAPSATPPTSESVAYRRANELASVAQADPLLVDPSHVERALHSHAATQNALAEYLLINGCEVFSPSRSDPDFDICWTTGSSLWVGEIKSVTASNEERQLRLGLGQVLRYRHLLQSVRKQQVNAALVLDRPPTDSAWVELCAPLGVVLCWPGSFDSVRAK